MVSVPLYGLKDFGDIKRFYLLLGPACNMHCRHCSQSPEKGSCGSFSSVVSPKTLATVKNYIAYRSSDRKRAEHSVLVFWGGEPLVYWDLLKSLIVELDDRSLDFGKFRFAITTNGTLLDEEKVAFLNEHNVLVIFSYDAPHPFAVRGYVSDEVCALVRKLKRYFVSSTGSAYNCDQLLAVRCLRAKFPNSLKYNVFAWTRFTFPVPEDLYGYDWDLVRESIRKIRVGAQLDDIDALRLAGLYVSCFRLGINKDFDAPLLQCVPGVGYFNLTLDGKIPICHNGDNFFATVDDTMPVVLERAKSINDRLKNRQCADCGCRYFCPGCCFFDYYDADGKSVTCEKFRKRFYRIVEEELSLLGRPVTDEETAWFREQEALMDKQVEEFLSEGRKYADG